MHSYENNLAIRQHRAGDRWLLFLALCLAGYALAGKGFAYFGVYPLFIGEVCLVAGVLTWLFTRGWLRIAEVGAAVALLPVFAWGTLRLLPGVQVYRFEAVRDAVIWGYAVFAVIVASLIVADPQRLPRLIEYYRKFSKVFLIGILFVFFIFRFAREALPHWPGTDMPIIHEKEGDILVHLSGILAFWMSDRRRIPWFWIILMTLDIALMGVVDRAGLLSFLAVMFVCLLVKPNQPVAWRTTSLILCGLMFMWASNFNLVIPGAKGRSVSFDTFAASMKSTFGFGQTRGGFEGTKQWRLQWWGEIVNYTFNGPYFWTGKGFGINLADDDGFQVQEDHSLRSPHNIHMSVLARMGVPGLLFWAAMHCAWMFAIAETYLRARRREQARWAGLMLFLFCYYVAFMINGSFDVFIEGPMGGIWFWTIYGTGIAAIWVWRNCPEVLADGSEVDESARRAQLLSAAGWRRPGLPVGAGAS